MTSTSLPLTPETLSAAPDRFPVAGPWDFPSAGPPENDQPTTLAEVADHEARAYRAWGTPTGEFLARHMERLAQLVRWTGANSPDEHDARMEIWDDEVRDQWYDRGFQEGQQAGRRDAARARAGDRF